MGDEAINYYQDGAGPCAGMPAAAAGAAAEEESELETPAYPPKRSFGKWFREGLRDNPFVAFSFAVSIPSGERRDQHHALLDCSACMHVSVISVEQTFHLKGKACATNVSVPPPGTASGRVITPNEHVTAACCDVCSSLPRRLVTMQTWH